MGSVDKVSGEVLGQAIDVAVLRKGLDVMEANGEAAVELIESAGEVTQKAPPISKSPHLGQLVDFYA
ncbi:MAG: putative motility protein [Myxococcota bacterium]|nr:putative motility protein [Myxococcota bacterium]